MAVTQPEKKTNYFVAIISLVVILVAVGIVVFVKCPSSAVIFVMRVLMAIGASGFVTMLNPSIKIENKMVKAGGAIAFGVLVYIVNPPKLFGTGDDGCPSKDFIKGTVFINGKTVKGSQVDLIGDIQLGKNTNDIGAFDDFLISEQNRPDSLKLRIQYSKESTLEPVDTIVSFKTDEVLNKSVEIRINPRRKPQPLAGYVWDQRGHGLPGVIVSAEGVKDTTDDGGYFKLDLYTKESSVSVNFSRRDYQSTTYTYPFPNREVSLTLTHL